MHFTLVTTHRLRHITPGSMICFPRKQLNTNTTLCWTNPLWLLCSLAATKSVQASPRSHPHAHLHTYSKPPPPPPRNNYVWCVTPSPRYAAICMRIAKEHELFLWSCCPAFFQQAVDEERRRWDFLTSRPSTCVTSGIRASAAEDTKTAASGPEISGTGRWMSRTVWRRTGWLAPEPAWGTRWAGREAEPGSRTPPRSQSNGTPVDAKGFSL